MSRKIATLLLFATLACAADERAEQAGADTPATSGPDQRGVILFLGTSLTAGYGVGAEHAYPAIIQQKLDSAGYPLRVVNAGLSGETSAGGLRRVDWSLQQPIEILVLELGANDGLRGLPVSQLRDNLEQIIKKTRARYPSAEIVIAGMEAPPNLGARYTREFRGVFRDLAIEYDAALISFLLQDVATVPELNLPDGIHPNEEGQRIVADGVWQVLETVLKRNRQ